MTKGRNVPPGDPMDELARRAVPILDSTIMQFPMPGGPNAMPLAPIVWLNTEGRPEVGDLGRVHTMEGGGDASYRFAYGTPPPPGRPTRGWFILRCTLSDPVTVEFDIAFQIPLHFTLLDAIRLSSTLMVILDPPPAWRKISRPGQHGTLPTTTFLEDMDNKFGIVFSQPQMQQLHEQLTKWAQKR